jgi:DNA-binding IscR family transcriptional regulator
MDTTTVLEIIKMIDRQLDMINGYALHNKGGLTETEAISAIAGRDTLNQLRDHLQSFIEGQLNAAENSTPE